MTCCWQTMTWQEHPVTPQTAGSFDLTVCLNITSDGGISSTHQMEQVGLPRMVCMSVEGRTSMLVCLRYTVIPTDTIWPNVKLHTLPCILLSPKHNSKLQLRYLCSQHAYSPHCRELNHIRCWSRKSKLADLHETWHEHHAPIEFQTKYLIHVYDHRKDKAIPLQAWTHPQGSRRLRLPDFKTIDTWWR